MKTTVILMTGIISLWITTTFAQAGILDPDFGGGDGQVSTAFLDNQPCQGNAIAVQQEGKLFVSGVTKGVDGREHALIACYYPDGALDHTFNGNGKMIISVEGATMTSQAITVLPDNTILVVTTADHGAEINLNVYKFNPDGSPDTSFGGDGIVVTDINAVYLSGRAIALQPDGKILVGGYLGYDELFDVFYLVRYHPDGNLDHSFDGDGIVTTAVGESYTHITSILVQPDGKIIAAGDAIFNEYTAFALARYHADGSLDLSFGEVGIAKATFEEGEDGARGAALQPDGKIVLGGYAYSAVSGANDFAAARFNPNGTLDSTFHGDGMTTVMVTSHSDQARSMLLQPDGKIVLGGFAHSNLVSTGADMALVRLNENGIPDYTFDDDGIAIYEDNSTSGEISKMAFQSDGKIVGTGVIRTDGLNAIRVSRFISGLTVSTSNENLTMTSAALFPNPASDHIFVEYSLEKEETISIQLCNIQGAVVKTIVVHDPRHAGQNRESLQLDSNFPSGQYFITFRGKDWMHALKVIIE